MPTPMLDPETVLKIDGYLKPNVPAILHRHESFRRWKAVIDEHEGGYEYFTKGYLQFGFNVGNDGEVVYREWAPNAKEAYLIGEFSEIAFVAFIAKVGSLKAIGLQMIGTGPPMQ
jgi:1,4-alpha-glucan branching enzyme